MSAAAAAGVSAWIKGIGKGWWDGVAFIQHVIASTRVSAWNRDVIV